MARSSDRLVSIVALCLAGAGAIACGSSDEKPGGGGGTGGTGSVATCTTQGLLIKFPKMYSAFDGTPNKYKVPAIVVDAAGKQVSGAAIDWSVKDPSIADVNVDDVTGFATFTMLKAGETTIQANSQEACGTAPLSVRAATTAEWEAGKARYNNGNPLPTVALVNGRPDPNTDFGAIQAQIEANPPACTNCHGETATTGFFKTVSHTPQQTAGFSDDDLKKVVRDAVIPPGGEYSNTIPKFIWEYFHKWKATDDELNGLVVYLRSLTPKAQGIEVDFGGMRPPGGTGGATGAGGAAATGGATAAGGTTSTGGAAATGGAGATGGTGG